MTDKYIEDFAEAIYPGYGALHLASFSERVFIKDATETINTLRTENERLREALKWYAEPTNWLVEALPTGGAATRIDLDRGDRARTALGEDGKNG